MVRIECTTLLDIHVLRSIIFFDFTRGVVNFLSNEAPPRSRDAATTDDKLRVLSANEIKHRVVILLPREKVMHTQQYIVHSLLPGGIESSLLKHRQEYTNGRIINIKLHQHL